MKILIITKSFTKGGSASGASNLLRALEAVGQEVICCDAYANPKGMLGRAARFAERAFERVCFDAETHCLRISSPVFDLPTLIAWHQPDIVQLCDVSGNAIRFSDFDKVPCPIVHRMSDFWPYHGPAHYATEPDQGHWVSQWLLRKTVFSGRYLPDARVAPSHWLADHLGKHTEERHAIHVIRNAVNIPEFVPRKPPRPGTLRFGFISNSVLDPRKGFCKLIPRLQTLSNIGMDVSLHVHGRISDDEKSAASDIEIFYHGAFGRGELQRVFDSFDILLCPSRLDNSPNVLCEALAFGRPVIGQRETGMDSYIEERTGALLNFWTDSSDMHAEFLENSLRIASDYSRFSASAAKYAAHQLSPRTIGLAYLGLYNELSRKRRKLSRAVKIKKQITGTGMNGTSLR